MAVQDIPEGTVATGPNGETAVRRNGVWVREAQAPSAAPARQGYTLQPMQTPTDRRAEEDRAYRRQRDSVADQRAASSEARAAASEQRAQEAAQRSAQTSGMVGADARARFMAGLGPLREAQANFTESEANGNPLNRNWGAALIDQATEVPFLRTIGDAAARVVGGEDYQKYAQAASTYESALLPILSGAAVTPSEAARLVRADLPQIGDTEEVLQRKAKNRALRINAVARGIGQPEPYDINNLSPENEDRAIAAVVAAAPQAPQGPGGSPENPIDLGGLGPDDLMALQPGQFVRRADGTVYALPSAPFRAPEQAGDEREGSAVIRPQQTPDEIASDRRADTGIGRKIEAAGLGAIDTLTFGLSDEIGGALDAVSPSYEGTISGFEHGFGAAYRHNRDLHRANARADAEDVPVSRGVGQVAGALAFAPRAIAQGGARIAAATGKEAVRAATRQAARRGAVEGAAFGGAYGFGSGEGSAVERAPGAAVGAAIGAPVGAVAPYAANALGRAVVTPAVDAATSAGRFAGRQIGRAGNALGVPGAERLVEATAPNALRSGLHRLADRAPQNVNALNANAQRFAAETIDPTAVDVVDDGARGMMRALATRQTPARQGAREFAANRAEGLQDRISTQARRTISDDPRMPSEIRDQAAQEARRRAAPLYEQAYSEPVEITAEVRGLLQTPAGQAAMQRAQRIAANERREINLDQPDMQTLDYVKRGLDDVLEGYRDRTTGRMVLDTEGRAVQDVLTNFRSELDRLSPTYASARATYADSAKLQGAVDLGEQFMRMEADQFAAAVARLSPEEQQVARAAARRAVERAAGTQGQAPGVAQRLAGGREQGMRSSALLDDAEPMQRAMGAELEAVRNAQAVNPGQGSQTSMNLQDAGNAAGVLGTIRRPLDAAAGAVINRVRSRGFNDQEAEAVVMAAIDPARTREVINILEQRMSRREARSLARVIRRQVTIGLQSGQQQ